MQPEAICKREILAELCIWTLCRFNESNHLKGLNRVKYTYTVPVYPNNFKLFFSLTYFSDVMNRILSHVEETAFSNHRQIINIYQIQILTSLNPLFHISCNNFLSFIRHSHNNSTFVYICFSVVCCSFSRFFFYIFLVWFSLDTLEKALVPLALEDEYLTSGTIIYCLYIW